MIERFLRYALEHGGKLRAVYLKDGAPRQKTIRVIALDEESFTFTEGSSKKPVTLPLSDLLSCDYARGDHGGAD